jgi:hypothetical protein
MQPCVLLLFFIKRQRTLCAAFIFHQVSAIAIDDRRLEQGTLLVQWNASACRVLQQQC